MFLNKSKPGTICFKIKIDILVRPLVALAIVAQVQANNQHPIQPQPVLPVQGQENNQYTKYQARGEQQKQIIGFLLVLVVLFQKGM